MGSQKTSLIRIVLLMLLVFAAVFPVLTAKSEAQTNQNYWVTVKPTGDSQMYTSVDRNWTLSFEAVWSYGSNSGQPISDAVVSIEVFGASEGALGTLDLNTTSGYFVFNYSSSTADKITFTPTQLKTQDGAKWTSALVTNDGVQAYGLQSTPVTVWWDTFQVSLLSQDTDSSSAVALSVNITYQLLPQEGLTLPAADTYSNQTFLPKTVIGANVTINGVNAQETGSTSVYSAKTSTVFPTAYVLVKVSQSGWTTTNTALSFGQKANGVFWSYAEIIALIAVAATLLLYVMLARKPSRSASRGAIFLLIGSALLLATSVVSLYWGAVAVEASLHGFNWLILAVTSLCAFAVGALGGVMSLRRKNEALVIFAVCVPLIVNLSMVSYALGAYSLAVPWMFIFASTITSIASGLLIAHFDDQFTK
ncbi:MAG: hypothetical protein ACLQO7_06240 [Candidatus Bathyarchaeia archaeon]